jgi:DNA mismatch repair ATPase MutS
LIGWLQARQNQIFALVAALLLWELQFAVVIERWRAAHNADVLRAWLETVGEVEALLALAGYAYEHPADPFPEILDRAEAGVERVCFEGTGLGHPLLPEHVAVRNDLCLDASRRLYLVSGSNMSGKSTFLRTVGVNAVLALAGAPVRATHLKIAPLTLGASLRTQDSLQNGVSRFYAEVLRLRDIVERAAESGSDGTPPLLFLLDEILHGTNSHDRRVGAEAILRALLRHSASGLATTHDLALTGIADVSASSLPGGVNVHFEDQMSDGKMTFDYRLRPGVVEKSNAIALMRAVGLEV